MIAYYNEFDLKAAAWLRELIAAGEIAPGIVDERSISDVTPGDLAGFTQCHFFAGIGGWSLALRLAGWPDDRPVWTGSCPCQPFSAAGKRGGVADERHLWPHWFHLISKCQPASVFGEQVASRDGLGWLDLVSADLEAAGYAIGAADLCAAGVGAPHIRQRLYFGAVRLGDAIGAGLEGHAGDVSHARGWALSAGSATAAGRASGLADADGGNPGAEWQQRGGEHGQQSQDGGAGGMGQPNGAGRDEGRQATSPARQGHPAVTASGGLRPGAPHEFWQSADWLHCRDGKWRPVEPGTFPLAHGIPGRVGLLRGYGNAIVPPLAAQFVQAFQEALEAPARHPMADLPLFAEAAE